MAEGEKITIGCSTKTIIYWTIGILVSMVGYQIHHSFFWSIVDLFFWPFALLKWICFQEINVTVMKHAFDWFLK